MVDSRDKDALKLDQHFVSAGAFYGYKENDPDEVWANHPNRLIPQNQVPL